MKINIPFYAMVFVLLIASLVYSQTNKHSHLPQTKTMELFSFTVLYPHENSLESLVYEQEKPGIIHWRIINSKVAEQFAQTSKLNTKTPLEGAINCDPRVSLESIFINLQQAKKTDRDMNPKLPQKNYYIVALRGGKTTIFPMSLAQKQSLTFSPCFKEIRKQANVHISKRDLRSDYFYNMASRFLGYVAFATNPLPEKSVPQTPSGAPWEGSE